jgi:hypothetical protein
MNRPIALTLSSLFHPVWVNLMGLLSLLLLSPYLHSILQPEMVWFYVLFIFSTTALVPMLAVAVLKLSGRVQSIMLEEQEERNIPYLVTAMMYLFDYYFLSQLHSSAAIRAYLLACASIVVVVVIINHFYKISVHAASLGALAGIVVTLIPYALWDIRWLLAFVVIATGATLSARLFMNAHTPKQLWSGWLLGFLVMMFIL